MALAAPKASAKNPPDQIDAQIEDFVDHLQKVVAAFNGESRVQKIGIEISADDLIDGLRRGARIKRAVDFANGDDDSGILHTEQIVTAVKAIGEILRGNGQVLVQGAMQSGKTTTSLALQLAAPTYYLATGKPLYPFYLLTAHSSQFEQTLRELTRFLAFYSDITFKRTGKAIQLAHIDPVFERAATLENYRESVLKDALKNGLFSQQITHEDFMATRVMGQKIKAVAERMKSIDKANFVPLLIIDEPQFGVMDRIVVDRETGEIRKVSSVFKRMFREIEKVLKKPKGSHVFVALSATPYELFDVDGIAVVQQKIGRGYQGYNFFAGSAVDPESDCSPPTIQSLTQAANIYDEPFVANINLAALNKSARFIKLRKQLGLSPELTHKQYRTACVASLRGLLRKIADNNAGEVFGVCIRSRNNNDFARTFGEELGLSDTYETLNYLGGEVRGMSVKRLLTQRQDKRKPYLLFVTNRARMGDAFPTTARYFIELTERFSDMNSMFQGFIGRSCGYGKRSTVILSDANALMINTVVDAKGRYIYNASRGSVIINKKRRGRPSGLIPIERDGDPVIEKFFAKIDAGFRMERLEKIVSRNLRLKRNSRGKNPGLSYAPIFRLAKQTEFFKHVEDPANRESVAPGYPDFHIVREDEVVQITGTVTGPIGYALDKKGGCSVIAREFSGDLRQSGVRGRGSNRKLTPQIVFVKYDRKTNRPIIGDVENNRLGEWKAYAIVLPLLRSVMPLISSESTLPRLEALFADLMNDAERTTVRRATSRLKKARA